MSYDEIYSKLKNVGQEQLLDFYDELNDEEKENLLKQIEKIDFSILDLINHQNEEKKKGVITPLKGGLSVADIERNREEYTNVGIDAIRQGKVAALLLAGGQGTRLGSDKPKGMYNIGITKDVYILEMIVRNLMDVVNQTGTWIPLYVMTSEKNNDDTVKFFKDMNYFGYDKEKVVFFTQGELPVLTESGKIVLEDGRIQTGSNGNGGVYKAMKDHHIIEDMKEKNIKWVYICGVDNIMVNPISPIFIGKTILDKLQIASKSVAKAYPEEKVGVFCRRNNKPSTVEYIELSEKMRNERDEYGELYYGEANIISHLLSIDAIEKITNFSLPYHIAKKKGLYKFETFIFDAFEYFDDMLVMRVKREDEFAPIKNKEGVDSPETAKEIYERKMEKDGRTKN